MVTTVGHRHVPVLRDMAPPTWPGLATKPSFVGASASGTCSICAIIGGAPFQIAAAVSVALSAAIANALVAQAATARLLFAMARDRQLPRFLAHVHPTRQVPERAVLALEA
jgi:amino acid transporter